jgi:hypothetical protein
VEPHEAAGRHERQGEEEHAGVAATVGGLAGGEAESERDRPDQPEEHEVEPGIHEVGVEL